MLVYQRVCSTFSRHRRSKSKMATPSSHAPPWSLFRLVLNGFTRLKFSTLPRAPISGLSDLPSVQTSSERNCWGRESRSYWRRNWRYASLKFQRCAFELLMIQICQQPRWLFWIEMTRSFAAKIFWDFEWTRPFFCMWSLWNSWYWMKLFIAILELPPQPVTVTTGLLHF